MKILVKNIKTKNGSRYYQIDALGKWWEVRVSDHVERADRSGLVDLDKMVASKLTTSGMDIAESLTIILPKMDKTEKEIQSILKKVFETASPYDGATFFLVGKNLEDRDWPFSKIKSLIVDFFK